MSIYFRGVYIGSLAIGSTYFEKQDLLYELDRARTIS